ncbi:MAG: SDR family NAD(P)-dependent oxidoreductase, partial [Bacteroidota bacterium]|nr:SDR family NAD(P)-dependent oxidoreductase [Bacteroidota bacterium]
MNIGGNTVLITGGATGIGFAFAEYFLEAGNEVVICGRREKKLIEARGKHPELHIRVCDIASDYDRRSLFDWISSDFSNLNVLVNNAGIQREINFTNGLSEFIRGENEISINLEAQI